MQADLFEYSAGSPLIQDVPKSEQKTAFLERYQLTVRLDQLMVGVIASIVLLVFVFTTGVESGKRFGLKEIKAERNKHDRIISELRDKLRLDMFKPSDPVSVDKNAALAVAIPTEIKDVVTIKPAVQAAINETPSTSTTVVSYHEGHEGKYTIQLVTYKTKSAADRQSKLLSEKGYKSYIIPKGDYLQVCVNAFQNREEAKKILTKLRSNGLASADAYIRSFPAI